MQVRRAITLPDPRDPVLTLTISSSDPAMAANLENWLVEDLNAYLREKALIETRSMLAYLNEKMPVSTDQDLRVALVQLLKGRSEEHTSELQSLMRITNAVLWLNKKKDKQSTQKQ